MATITVKNIPDDPYERVKAMAASNRRSINSEIIMCLERSVGSRRISTDAVVRRARELRELSADYVLTNEEVSQAKRRGRP